MKLSPSDKAIKILLCLIFIMIAIPVDAHVKWFTDGSYADRPLTIGEIVNQLFLILLGCCLVAISLGVFLDYKLSYSAGYARLNNWFENRKNYGLIVMRVAAAMLLILSWQGDAMMAPTLKVPSNYDWIGWYQFVLAFLLLMPKTVPYGGIGMILLYIIGNFIYHPFHMLDYFLFVGAGFYLAARGSKKEKWQKAALTFLYFSVGFSICWVGLEKFVYPDWSLFLVKTHPQLALGLNFNFFVTSIGFVEFSLGYLLLVCLLQRPLAVLITFVFFLTTTVFGKTEVIGHTLIHGCLIVFLLEGPGTVYTKLTNVFKTPLKRMVFSCVLFVITFFVLAVAYHSLAFEKYDKKQSYLNNKTEHTHSQIELAGLPKDQVPTIDMDLQKDPMGGYNIHLFTDNFKFTPENANKEDVMGEGHAHLHINGAKTARIYGPWYHLESLPEGTYEITISLNSNKHEDYVYRGVPIEVSQTIVEKGK